VRPGSSGNATPLVEACDVAIAGRPVSVRVHEGDCVLLVGPPAAGKSWLARVLAGVVPPSGGVVRARGRVRAADAPNRVALAPPFHDNHQFVGTLAYNVLAPRPWPHGEDDETEAEALCRELGLGPLLDRMPAGMQTLVGEGGWQLSHGERSRVFLARALLQRADVVILDGSFAALDPPTLSACVSCARRRARALVVIGEL
jgi:ATP-binding cassette subfamily B protein